MFIMSIAKGPGASLVPISCIIVLSQWRLLNVYVFKAFGVGFGFCKIQPISPALTAFRLTPKSITYLVKFVNPKRRDTQISTSTVRPNGRVVVVILDIYSNPTESLWGRSGLSWGPQGGPSASSLDAALGLSKRNYSLLRITPKRLFSVIGLLETDYNI